MLCQQMKTKRHHSRHNLQKKVFISIVSLFLSITISDAFNLHTNIIINDIHHHQFHHVSYRGVRIKTQQQLFSAPPKDSEINIDAIEDDVKPLNKKIKKSKSQKRKARTEVIGQGTLPTEPTAKKNKKKGNKSIKSIVSAESIDMPPWLSQYEDEDFASSYHLSKELQSVSYEEQQQQNTEMQRLQLALNGIIQHEYPSSTDAIIPYFTPSEIHEIMDSIRVASNGNTSLMKGCADFLYLMLTLEEEVSSTLNSDEPWDNTQAVINSHSIMTRDVLVAAAFHYCDCVRARKAGVYDYARQALEMKHEPTQLPLAEEVDNDKSIVVKGGTMSRRTQLKSSIESYGKKITQIATGAATLKRAEIMATTIKSKGMSKIKSQSKTSQQTNVDAEILRSFMVSLSEDWRALVIRSAACLYRLKGISDGSNVDDGESSSTGSITLSKSTVSVAKDALRVHAPLAQRIGMQRLKSELENCAFKILYPRQYAVATSLYRDMDELNAIVQVLTTRIEQLLRSDPMFAAQIQDVTVTSRVKEPYSLWKKMIRIRKQAADEAKSKDSKEAKGGSPRSPPSLKWVPDTIALRVVLSAARTSSLEDDESLRTREKLLCYYALQLISNIWEESEANERKDYIKNPKPNGYQSLHYTASLVIVGEEWPFEVQIRSEEMHRIAEFGVAAHFDYKHKPKKMLPAAQESTSPMLALPPSEQVAITSSSSLVPARKKKKKGRVASYIEALTTSREAIKQNNVFVFLSSTESALDGTIISVNSSAKVSDVLKQYVKLDRDNDDDLDLDEVVIFQNGVRLKTLEKELSNGDVLTVTSGILDI